MPTLVSTVGAANANTFAELDYYKDYIASRRPAPTWAALAIGGTSIDDLLIGDLIASCRILNSGMSWTGLATTDEQKLITPRTGWYSRNKRPIIDWTDNPEDLKDAQCELAVQIHDADVIGNNAALDKAVKSVKVGSIGVEFQAVGDSLEAVNTAMRLRESQFQYLRVIPDAVRMLLVPSWYVEAELNRPFFFEVL